MKAKAIVVPVVTEADEPLKRHGLLIGVLHKDQTTFGGHAVNEQWRDDAASGHSSSFRAISVLASAQLLRE
jgi:hypothetical protein